MGVVRSDVLGETAVRRNTQHSLILTQIDKTPVTDFAGITVLNRVDRNSVTDLEELPFFGDGADLHDLPGELVAQDDPGLDVREAPVVVVEVPQAFTRTRISSSLMWGISTSSYFITSGS